ncbi:MAG: hypothetical protein ACI4L9_01675 [Candidatus Coproplasma sp.]
MDKSSSGQVLTVIISWLFLLYFVILFAERAQSLIRCCMGGIKPLYETAFDGYVNTLTALSLVATLVMLTGFNGNFWRSLFNSDVAPDYTLLSVTSGVLLLSGMVHTEHTIAPVQFVSYGMLIVAMVLRTVITSAAAEHPFKYWFSLAYLVAFAMAVPVMYRTQIANATAFHIIEAATAVVLVAAFTFMTQRVFVGKGENLLYWIPFIIVAVADTVILWMRWQEEVNVFVLIFIILTAILFVVGKILFHFSK